MKKFMLTLALLILSICLTNTYISCTKETLTQNQIDEMLKGPVSQNKDGSYTYQGLGSIEGGDEPITFRLNTTK